MSKKEKNILGDEAEGYFMTLVDEKGKEREFELYAQCSLDGNDYFALAPVDGADDEYVLLRGKKVGEEIFFETIDDDDEFERVEDYMGDILFGEVDYDED